METLEFLVMVDGDVERSELVAAIRDRFPDALPRKENSVDLRDNWLEVWENESADADLTSGSDGYLYYPWRVEVTPTGTVNEERQIQLARELVAAFAALGTKPVVCANFEDRV